MTDPSELAELTTELRKLVAGLAGPKRKSWSDHLASITPFLSTVVIALISLWFTRSAETSAARRQEANDSAQAVIQRAQVRIEELKALTSFAPLLASEDSAQRDVARIILDAVRESDPSRITKDTAVVSPTSNGAARNTPPPRGGAGAQLEVSLLDSFLAKALDKRESEENRARALRQAEQIALLPNTSRTTRDKVVNTAAEIAGSAETAGALRRTAAEVIARIRSIDPTEAEELIAASPLERKVSEIVVHHAGAPFSIAQFRSATVMAIAKWQTSEQGWQSVSWHYAITPDGKVWLGMPLNEQAIHATGHNKESISVLLFLDGDKELPTASQKESLRTVMQALTKKTGMPLDREGVLALHRDIQRPPAQKTCPGRLITRDSVLAWSSQGGR